MSAPALQLVHLDATVLAGTCFAANRPRVLLATMGIVRCSTMPSGRNSPEELQMDALYHRRTYDHVGRMLRYAEGPQLVVLWRKVAP